MGRKEHLTAKVAKKTTVDGIVGATFFRAYWPLPLSILLASFTPLSPFTYRAIPR
jgi:hypothetical protein